MMQANLGSKITNKSRNPTDLTLMKRNRARIIAERFNKRLVSRTNSNSYASNSEEECSSVSLFCSTQALIQNRSNFKNSGAPSRFMYYRDGTWFGFSAEVFESLKAGFVACKPMVDVSIDGSRYLFDFLRMFQIDLVTGNQRSISWIDVNAKSFFPKFSVCDEFNTVPEVPICPKLEVEIKIDRNSLKRKINPSDSAEEHSDESSSNDQPNTLKRPRVPTMVLDRTKWANMKYLNAGDENYEEIKNIFMSGLRKIDLGTTITSINRCLHTGPLGIARLEAFQRQIELTKSTRGASNVRLAWHGTSAKGIASIVTHGFGIPNKVSGSESYGVGIYLSPPRAPHTSASLSEADDNGEKHIVLCRVILGNMEKVEAGSHQFHPTSEQFDTGVDNLENPRWHIVWSTHMNRHILPEYVVSYKSSNHHPQGLPSQSTIPKRSSTSTMSIPKLFSEMKGSLPSMTIQELERLYSMYQAGEVNKDVLIRQLRSIAGDKLLAYTIRKIQRAP